MKYTNGIPEYSGTLDVIRKVVRNEGIFALWKGEEYYAITYPCYPRSRALFCRRKRFSNKMEESLKLAIILNVSLDFRIHALLPSPWTPYYDLPYVYGTTQ